MGVLVGDGHQSVVGEGQVAGADQAEALAARDKTAAERLALLDEVGLGYLPLGQPASTLSGGEAQRLKLVTELTKGLQTYQERSHNIAVKNLYLLEEPTIGLHARDNLVLLDTLRKLREKGNTVVVVEHDEAIIRAADHVIDIGPGGQLYPTRVVLDLTVSELEESTRGDQPVRLQHLGVKVARGLHRRHHGRQRGAPP